MTVVFSALVGEGVNSSNLLAWHTTDGGNSWTAHNGDIEYDGLYASITVGEFSGYAFSQIPEPSTYAMILGFAYYRKRK